MSNRTLPLVEMIKLGEQEALARELEVEKVKQETKVEDISQGTMKHEIETKIEIRIKETDISTIEVEQEHKEGLGQEVEIKAEDERRNRRDPLKEP